MGQKKIISGILFAFVAIVLILLNIHHSQIILDEDLKQTRSTVNDQTALEADNPEMAALQNYYMTLDPALDWVPTEKLFIAYQETKEIFRRKEYKSSSSDLEWIETGSNMGGRTRAMMWDPNDPEKSKIWAASITGGLWYNNNIYNNSSNWQAVNDFWPSLSISCLVADPNNPMIFYAGTGEYQTARNIYRESSGLGIGIWKSLDGGETWEILPSTEDFKYISDLKVRNEDAGSVIYAGVVSGVYHDEILQSEPNDGLYRSTDGGESWQQVLPNIVGEDVPFAPADIEMGPDGRIFVGTLKNLEGDGGATILYSDWGTPNSWTVFDNYEEIIQNDFSYPVPGRVILACAPSDANRVYALVGAGWYNSSDFNYAQGRYILQSFNGGQNWIEKSLPGNNPDWANISWHALMAGVNPTDQNELYVGGKDVWKSVNGGNSWSKLSDWTLMYSGGGDDYVHCDQHLQLYVENSSDSMFMSTDGGIFCTENASSANPVFLEKNKNYSTLQFYTCNIHPVPGSNIFVGGLQDNGTLVYTGFPLDINDMVDGGDGAYCFFDKTEPQIMITSTYYNLYTLFYDWTNEGEMGNDGTGIFINPADYDSENNILFANAVKFNNSYPNQILRISGIPENPSDEMISLSTGLDTWFSHVKVSPFSPDGASTLFLGSANGKLFKVVNAQNTPFVSEVETTELPEAYLSSLAFGKSEDTLLVTFTNFGVPSVWQTYNGGFSWENIEGNLPDMPIRWCIYHPQNTNQIMLATEIGIWTTNNASSDEVIWEPDAGMPNVRIDMIQMRHQDNIVLAATHGRGLMHTTWNNNPSTAIRENKQEIKIYPNPADKFIHVNVNTNDPSFVSIFDQIGKSIFEGKIMNNEMIGIEDWPKGIYLVKVSSGSFKSEKKIVKF